MDDKLKQQEQHEDVKSGPEAAPPTSPRPSGLAGSGKKIAVAVSLSLTLAMSAVGGGAWWYLQQKKAGKSEVAMFLKGEQSVKKGPNPFLERAKKKGAVPDKPGTTAQRPSQTEVRAEPVEPVSLASVEPRPVAETTEQDKEMIGTEPKTQAEPKSLGIEPFTEKRVDTENGAETGVDEEPSVGFVASHGVIVKKVKKENDVSATLTGADPDTMKRTLRGLISRELQTLQLLAGSTKTDLSVNWTDMTVDDLNRKLGAEQQLAFQAEMAKKKRELVDMQAAVVTKLVETYGTIDRTLSAQEKTRPKGAPETKTEPWRAAIEEMKAMIRKTQGPEPKKPERASGPRKRAQKRVDSVEDWVALITFVDQDAVWTKAGVFTPGMLLPVKGAKLVGWNVGTREVKVSVNGREQVFRF